ncbi:MAG: ABC transporter permease, partial [Rhodothermales bacterium]
PLLTISTDVIAMVGGYLESLAATNMDYRVFINVAFSSLRFSDILVDTMKTSIFGFLVGIVSCYMGYSVRGGTRDVGRAAMHSVVVSSLLILLADVLIVRISLMFFGDIGG